MSTTFLDFIRKTAAEKKVAKHYGPGPHKGTGTPQKIHGGARGQKGKPKTKLDIAYGRVTNFQNRYEKARTAFKKADKALEGSRAKRKRGEMTPEQLTRLAYQKTKAERAMNEAMDAWTKALKRERKKLGIP